MRIILAGHSGINKKSVINSLSSQLPKGVTVQAYFAEDEIRPDVDLYRPNELGTIWYNSFRKHVVQPWRNSRQASDIEIISMHLSWYVASHFFSPILSNNRSEIFEFLRDDFKPNFVIPLIDNVYRCQKRMWDHQIRFYFRLGEILRWRNLEVILADMLADAVAEPQHSLRSPASYPFERSPVFAIDHPVTSLTRYVLKPEEPRVYLSYPITEPRFLGSTGDKSAILETNEFRHYFTKAFTAFDPVTIDELPLKEIADQHDLRRIEAAQSLQDALFGQTLFSKAESDELKQARLRTFLSTWLDKDARLTLRSSDLWPRDDSEVKYSLIGTPPAPEQELSYQEVRGITVGGDSDDEHSELARQVRLRDFRLIDQSDCVIVFRPTRGKERWSDGTAAEARYALDTRKRLFVIHDEKDAPLRSPPFGQDLAEHNRVEVSGLENEEKRSEVFDQVQNLIRSRLNHTPT